MTLDEFLPLLSGVQRCASGHMATCPAHEDRKQSLHISCNGVGLGVKCHAGCATETVVTEMGLQLSDLFFEKSEKRHDEIIAEYPYRDAEGHLLYQVLRYEPKGFRQRRPDGRGGWVWSMQGVERVPYMLPEILASDDVIFIVEGEKDVHTLRAHGYLATTNAGGAGKWRSEWTHFFSMRRVILIPDMDEPGFDHINEIGAQLKSVADVRYIRLWGAKDLSEWFLFHTSEEFASLTEEAQDFDEPLSFILKEVQTTFEWPIAPVHDGLIGQIVQMIEPHSEADEVGLYMEILTTFGNCLGGGPYYKVGGTYHRGNLFLAICGETAKGRKGSAHDWVMEVFKQVDPGYVKSCVMGGLSSGEGVVHAVRDPRLNFEGKVLDEGVSDKRRLFFESELAGRTFNAMKREGNTLSALLRQAWEANTLSVATKLNDDHATGSHISIIGHATVKELLSTLRLSDIVGGFANRFLFFRVTRSKMLAVPSEPDPQMMQVLAGKLRHRLTEARKVQRVLLAPEAVETWVAMYTDLDKEADEEDENITPFLSRAAPQILRLALLLALVDGKREIGTSHLKTALGFWDFARCSVEYMMAVGMKGTLTADQEALFEFLDRQSVPIAANVVRESLHWNGSRFALVKGQLLRLRMINEKEERGTGGRPRRMLST